MKIYHNPRCRKSRETLELLNKKGVNPEIVLYLQDSPTKKELKELVKKLGINASELIRKTESIYKEHYKGQELSEDKWLEAMVKYPKLIERPIVVSGKQAIIGRPPENVLALF